VCEVVHLHVNDLDRSTGIRVIRRKKKTLAEDVLQVAREVFDYTDRYVAEEELKPTDWLFSGRCNPCFRILTIKKRDESGKVINVKRVKEKVCDGGHLTTRRALAVWDRILKKLGFKVPGRGIHTLRHFDLTKFYAATHDLRATQKRAGHSSSVITETYADVVDMEEKAQKAGITVSGAPWGPSSGREGTGAQANAPGRSQGQRKAPAGPGTPPSKPLSPKGKHPIRK
jgi:integrase